MAEYVALGDSYAAGAGAGTPANACFRSMAGYPVHVARALRTDVSLQACRGATTTDVAAIQLAALTSRTRVVTLTVGGNDLGFTDVLTECAKPTWMTNSKERVERALRFVRDELSVRMLSLCAQMRRRAPSAELVVTGYPRLFDGQDCNLATFFNDHDMQRMNDIADELASVIGAAASSVGGEFVDVREPFVDHAVCAEEEWIRGMSRPLEVSYHPNTAGHSAYAVLIARALGVTYDGGERPALAGEAAYEPVIEQGPPSGSPEAVFAPPDLLSDQSMAGARHWGLDPDDVAELVSRSVGRQPPIPTGPDVAPGGAPQPDVDQEAYDRLWELDEAVRVKRG